MSSIFPIREKISLDREPEPRLVDLDDETADEVFEALSSSTTRKIFLELHSQPQTASDLADVTETSVQNVQYHLEKLSDVDLVEVVDTWYSERGSEMKVYAPQDESLVMFAGRDKEGAFRRLLNRFAGVFAMLVPPSILAGWLANQRDAGVEEDIRGEYAMTGDDADDDDHTVAGDTDDAPAADDADTDDAEEDAEIGTQATDEADDEPADDGAAPDETPVPEEDSADTPAPDDDTGGDETLTATDFDGRNIEVSVNESVDLSEFESTEGETIYLVTDGTGGTDIMGVDPAVALAFFAGGLLVYGAFVLRKRVM